jgi:hypothetical protein
VVIPAARRQEVTVRRPLANRAPFSSNVSRAAERLSKAPHSRENQQDSYC